MNARSTTYITIDASVEPGAGSDTITVEVDCGPGLRFDRQVEARRSEVIGVLMAHYGRKLLNKTNDELRTELLNEELWKE